MGIAKMAIFLRGRLLPNLSLNYEGQVSYFGRLLNTFLTIIFPVQMSRLAGYSKIRDKEWGFIRPQCNRVNKFLLLASVL